jgi:hypothetical protein
MNTMRILTAGLAMWMAASASAWAVAMPGADDLTPDEQRELARRQLKKAARQARPAAPESDLSDVKTNFSTVVSAFVAARSENGYWAFRDRKSGRKWKLALAEVDTSRLRRVGPNRFAAPVVLQDVAGRGALTARFVADFSSDDWRVVGMTVKEAL